MSTVTISGNSQGGSELGYAETSTQKTSTSTVTGNDAWAGLTITVTVGSRPIIVEAFCSASWTDTSGDGAVFSIYESTTQLACATLVGGASLIGATPMYCRTRLTPTPGSHTYLVKVNALTGGTATFNAAAVGGGTATPAWIQATEV